METNKYVKAVGIYYPNEVKAIRKNTADKLQPIYEAFINAWDAVMERFGKQHLQKGKIGIDFYFTQGQMDGEMNVKEFQSVVIKDNGTGVTKKDYSRLVNLRDGSKSVSNRGTGRLQYIHYFDTATIESVYKDYDDSFKAITLTLSKKPSFLDKNAIMREDFSGDSDSQEQGTKLTLSTLLDKKADLKYYSCLQANLVKTDLLHHYLSLFCENASSLPLITIRIFINNVEEESSTLEQKDIPKPNTVVKFKVPYSKIDQGKVVQIKRKESFEIVPFVLSQDILENNSYCFVSNGALGSEKPIEGFSKKDAIDGKRYLFLVRSKYLDEIDDDLRGNLKFVKKSEFKKNNDENLFPEECLLEEDIKDCTYRKIVETYPELKEKQEAAEANLEKLQEMFLLDPDTVENFRKKLKVSDTDAQILQAIYESDMEKIAVFDAKLKAELEKLAILAPDEKEYEMKLKSSVDRVTKIVPMQNRTSLTRYVAHRKLVIEVFDMILNKELQKLQNGGRIDEKVLHNLIFRQHSSSTGNSDLWIFDDQYLYFEGCSESDFNSIKYKGEQLFKDTLTKEEEKYKYRQGKDMGDKRPDVLLYPEEGKCVIIEFKAPDVEVQQHLNQIMRYASLIHNLSKKEYNFTAYYGYLVGENVDIYNIQDDDSDFIDSASLGYIVRPHKRVVGQFGKVDGALYTEVITYSSLLERAKARNKKFLDILDTFEKL